MSLIKLNSVVLRTRPVFAQIVTLNIILHIESAQHFDCICRDKEINESGYDTLRISVGQAATKVWFNNTLKCTGNEVCLTSCWPSVPTSPVDQCSNEVGVRCSKCNVLLNET